MASARHELHLRHDERIREVARPVGCERREGDAPRVSEHKHNRRLQRAVGVLGGKQPDRDADVGQISRGEHRDDTRAGCGRLDVDRPDLPVRDLTANDPGVQLVLAVEVGAVAPVPGQQSQILDTRDRPADVGLRRRCHRSGLQ